MLEATNPIEKAGYWGYGIKSLSCPAGLLNKFGDLPGPTGLMVGSLTGAVVAMKIFVE